MTGAAEPGSKKPAAVDFFTPRRSAAYDFESMIVVIGNVLAGLLGISLFTATVRLSR